MPAPQIHLEDADQPGTRVTVEADPQVVVSPGPRPGTATLSTPGGRRLVVVGDYRDIHARVQDVAARAHESGDAPRSNTGVS